MKTTLEKKCDKCDGYGIYVETQYPLASKFRHLLENSDAIRLHKSGCGMVFDMSELEKLLDEMGSGN